MTITSRTSAIRAHQQDTGVLDARFTVRHRHGPAITAHLSLDAGQTLILFGPSGGGKTTILRALAGLHTPDNGSITCAGTPWYDTAASINVPVQERRVGYLFQDYALFPHLSVAANITYGMRRATRTHRATKLAELLDLLDLHAVADRKPGQISGGQAQRVALARALAPGPRLLLLDEPLSALDIPTRAAIRTDLRALLREIAIPTVIVTHERAEAYALGDQMTLVIAGATTQTGPVADLMDHPATLAAARALGFDNLLPATTTTPGRYKLADGQHLHLPTAPTQAAPTQPGPARIGAAQTGADVVIAARAEHLTLHEASARPDPLADGHTLTGTAVGTVDEGPHTRTRLCLLDGTTLTALTPQRDRPPHPGQTVAITLDPTRTTVLPP
jgi:molybdate transport system ATP-binding protein